MDSKEMANQLARVVLKFLNNRGFFSVQRYGNELESLIKVEFEKLEIPNRWDQQEPGIDY